MADGDDEQVGALTDGVGSVRLGDGRSHAASAKSGHANGGSGGGGGGGGHAFAGDRGERRRDKDKDRATRDQVLDQRTERILFHMVDKGLISSLLGVISTGKEANVYAAELVRFDLDEDDADGEAGVAETTVFRAAKVYKTSILSFVDRERYIAGEHRFRHADHRGNNRKMVKKWAEKEFRNLQRLRRAAIPCPYPIQLKVNVLLMSFLGDARGRAYPRLRDVELTADAADAADAADDDAAAADAAADASIARQWHALYVQLLGLVRRLYQVCRLVHADLSEYNILYHDRTLYLIDVSQSVGHDHPQTFDFLRMDIHNVGAFFRRKGVDTLRDRTVFEFVTAPPAAAAASVATADQPEFQPDALRRAVDALYAARPPPGAPGADAADAALAVDNEVFRNQYIPQSLQHVYDVDMVARGVAPVGADGADLLDGDDTLYRNLLVARQQAKVDDNNDSDDSDSDDSGSGVSLNNSDNDSVDGGDGDDGRPRGKRFEDKDAKRAHKHAIKEERRQKRQTKMPKKVKKRLVAQSSRKT